MSTVAEPGPRLMTVEEFLELPEDGISRELIRGELRERGMTIRNRFHCRVSTNVAKVMANWLDAQAEPRGEILTGDAGFRLKGTRDSLVGVDVAYVSAELIAATPPRQSIYDGAPVLAVEILSPSDKHEDIVEKVDLYLEAGVVVWEVNPDFCRVSVHRPGVASETFDLGDELTTEPQLPGFRVPVAALFGR